jgi:hypothetical protein
MQLTPAMPRNLTLEAARRVSWSAASTVDVAAAEWAILLGAGATSAVMAVLIRGLGIPGSTLLQGLLPMAAGLALVPRRGAGVTMGTAALATGIVLGGIGAGHVNPSELVRLFLLGACLEAGPARADRPGRVWLWFVGAGLAANLLGFGAKALLAQVGLEGWGGRGVFVVWPLRLASFAVCGALAGGLCAVVFFRGRGKARSS